MARDENAASSTVLRHKTHVITGECMEQKPGPKLEVSIW